MEGAEALCSGVAAIDCGECPRSGVAIASALARAAHPGQVLLCLHCSIDELELGDPWQANSLGEHLLTEDLPSIEVLQLCQRGSAEAFPPIRSARRIKHNLPSRTSPFFGRAEELSAVLELVRRSPITSLTGPSGVGKSALAWRAAVALTESLPAGVFVLRVRQGADHQELLEEAVQLFNDGSLVEKSDVAHFRPGAAGLVVLDECHQDPAEARLLCEAALLKMPGIRILAASRHPLRVHGEAELVVPGMACVKSEPDGVLPVEPDACRLFRDRLQLLGLCGDELPSHEITEVCELLEGRPSTLIAAAPAYARGGLPEVRERFGSRHEIEPVGSRRSKLVPAPAEVLSSEARSLMEAALAFCSDFSFDALMAVCPGLTPAQARTAAAELAGDGLFELTLSSEGQYRLSAACFEAEQFGQGPSSGACRSHALHYLHLAEGASGLKDGDLEHLQAESSNVRLALSRSLAGCCSADESLRFVAALGPYWHRRGHLKEAAELCRRACRLEGASDSMLLPKALNLAGTFMAAVGRTEEAHELHVEAEARAESAGDGLVAAMALANIASIHRYRGELAKAAESARLAAGHLRALGEKHRLASTLANLASILEEMGQFDEAKASLKESAGQLDSLEDPWSAARTRFNIAELELRRERAHTAMALYEASLSEAAGMKDHALTALSLEGIALAAAELGLHETAAMGFGAARRARLEGGCPLAESQGKRVGRALEELDRRMGRGALELALQSAGSLDLDTARRFLQEKIQEAAPQQ